MKPLVIFDTETTGLDRSVDWIIQFSAIKVDRESNKILDKMNEYIQPDRPYTMTINAYIKHRIHPDFLKDKPYFKDLAKQIYDFIQGCDLLTYNGLSFDIPFLVEHFRREGISWNPMEVNCYDSFQEQMRRNRNNLEEVFKRYCGRTMEEAGLQAHDGMSDVKACYAIFRHQQEIEPFGPEEVICDDNSLVKVDYEGKDVIALNFGKYKKVPIEILAVVDRNYINWLLGSHISDISKRIITEIINKTEQ